MDITSFIFSDYNAHNIRWKVRKCSWRAWTQEERAWLKHCHSLHNRSVRELVHLQASATTWCDREHVIWSIESTSCRSERSCHVHSVRKLNAFYTLHLLGVCERHHRGIHWFLNNLLLEPSDWTSIDNSCAEEDRDKETRRSLGDCVLDGIRLVRSLFIHWSMQCRN